MTDALSSRCEKKFLLSGKSNLIQSELEGSLVRGKDGALSLYYLWSR